MSFSLYFSNAQCDLALREDAESQLRAMASYLLWKEKVQADELSISLVDREKMSQLHQYYFADPSPTDCISFPMRIKEQWVPPIVLGEVIVCPAVALSYVQEWGGDVYEETFLYIIHGILHLMGYQDGTKALREEMVRVQKKYLRKLKERQFCLKSP